MNKSRHKDIAFYTLKGGPSRCTLRWTVLPFLKHWSIYPPQNAIFHLGGVASYLSLEAKLCSQHLCYVKFEKVAFFLHTCVCPVGDGGPNSPSPQGGWHLGATGLWDWATPRHVSSPSRREMEYSSSIFYTPRWWYAPPLTHHRLLCVGGWEGKGGRFHRWKTLLTTSSTHCPGHLRYCQLLTWLRVDNFTAE